MKVANCRNYILKPGLGIFQVKFLKTSYLQVFVHSEILLNNFRGFKVGRYPVLLPA